MKALISISTVTKGIDIFSSLFFINISNNDQQICQRFNSVII